MICFIRLHFFARFFRRGFAPSDFPTSKGSALAGHSQRACGPEDTAALDRLNFDTRLSRDSASWLVKREPKFADLFLFFPQPFQSPFISFGKR